MFLSDLLRGMPHTIPFTDDEGRLSFRPGSCTQRDKLSNDVHVRTEQLPVGVGNETTETETVIDCLTAEGERQRAQARVKALKAELVQVQAAHAAELADRDARLRDQDRMIDRLEAKLATAERLMAGAFQIIFHMGPALKALIQDDLGDPKLTDDKTAVKLEGVLYTVVMDIFNSKGPRVYLRPVGSFVPERMFLLADGRLSSDDQTLFIGHVGRIKSAETHGVDPVTGSINLVDSAAATV